MVRLSTEAEREQVQGEFASETSATEGPQTQQETGETRSFSSLTALIFRILSFGALFLFYTRGGESAEASRLDNVIGRKKKAKGMRLESRALYFC